MNRELAMTEGNQLAKCRAASSKKVHHAREACAQVASDIRNEVAATRYRAFSTIALMFVALFINRATYGQSSNCPSGIGWSEFSQGLVAGGWPSGNGYKLWPLNGPISGMWTLLPSPNNPPGFSMYLLYPGFTNAPIQDVVAQATADCPSGNYGGQLRWQGTCEGAPLGPFTTNVFFYVYPAPVIQTNNPLPSGLVGVGYSFTLQGNSPNFTWSAVGLPPGLQLSFGGVIEGVPTAAGSFPVVVTLFPGILPLTDTKTLTLDVGTCVSATPFPFGQGTAGCNGPHAIGASSCPKVGDAGFFLISNHAPASSQGLALITNVADTAGTNFLGLGFLLHVDLTTSSLVVLSPFYSDAQGHAAAALPIPSNPTLVGADVFAQAIWLWSTTCPAVPSGLSSSPGVRIRIQP